MELAQLKAFVAIAEESGFAQAASRLKSTEVVLRRSLDLLTDELGADLILETAEGIVLTPLGMALLPKAENILLEVEAIAAQAREFAGDAVGTVTMAVPGDNEQLRVDDFIAALKEDYPRLECRLSQRPSVKIVADLISGELDAGIFYGNSIPSDPLACEVLCNRRLVIAAPPGWKSEVEGAEIDNLLLLPWVLPEANSLWREVVDACMAEQNWTPSAIASSKDDAALYSLIRAGAGLGLMEEAAASWEENAGHLIVWRGEVFTVPLTFACLKQRQDDVLVKAVRTVLHKVWEAPEGG